ncbi:MAG: glycosyltransferase family 39 protein [Acetivibrio sp.]
MEKQKLKKQQQTIFFILLTGIIIRIMLSGGTLGHSTDINCFMSWADRMVETGCRGFYSTEIFTDYPPGYMYILWGIGKIRQIFNIHGLSFLSLLLIKLPAICCDAATAFLLWKVCLKKNEKIAVFITLVYLFNPVILLNSSVWGQVDSIFVLCVVLACYLVSEDRLPLSYFVFAVGILIKPQTLIFTPVILYGVWNRIFKNGTFCLREFSRQALWALAAVLALLLGMMPFGINTVVNQYIATMGSYPYASVNAYNLWNLLGMNWVSQETQILGLSLNKIGSLAIFGILFLTTYFWMKGNQKQVPEKGRYFISGAFIIGGMFTFSVRMHERYLYPLLILLLMAYLYEEKREWLISYFIFSIAHWLNVYHVLTHPENVVGKRSFISVMSSLILLGGYVYFAYSVYCYYVKNKIKKIQKSSPNPERHKENVSTMEETSIWKTNEKLRKKDYILMIMITGLYGAIAFYNLGDRQAPSTFYNFQTEGESIVFDFGSSTYLSKMDYFLGTYENREFRLEISENPEGPYSPGFEWTMGSVFAWDSLSINDKGQYFKFTSLSPKAHVGELVFYDFDGKVIEPIESYPLAAELLDEASLYDGRRSYHNSTYFDEIYHARTAYEYTQGLYSYENTHPPLGKIAIGAGIKIFGMNPFGWRFMGTLFGVLMLPLLYLFVFKIFGNSFLSTFATVLFAADFMHFTQTRIATIDVFVTFFIIAMYFFMFLYWKEKHKKWLLFSGISMGLGVACKWTGIYAGLGLAILFFIFLWNENRKKALKTCLWCLLFFIVIPVVIYTLSYLPFEDGIHDNLIEKMLYNQQTMLSYHTSVDATHAYSSWWYQWPTMYRPIWYYSGTISETIKEGISAFGNPFVWWAGIPAFFYCLYQAIKKKEKMAGFLSIAYLTQYLPWFFVTRITFIYHYFPSVPFIVLMITYVVYQLLKTNPGIWKKYSILYVGLAVGCFIMFYPVLSGFPISVNYVEHFLRWFDSWVLI